MSRATDRQAKFEYVVVGSGAVGESFAARLTEPECRVVVLGAGGEH
jgi:choline dehydrogenase-like flavoprotein